MPNDFYQLFNHAYSFAKSTANSGGITFSLPQNDYGIYGQQVDAFFNTMSRNEGATGNLAVWFVSDKGLTFYTHSLGATAAITAYVESRFPITASSTGLGLVDLRGSPDWSKIVGDGIVGPTRASAATVAGTNSQQYVNGIKAVFGVLKSQYPNIEWAIAGLPHLPHQMAYAPPVGQSPIWDSSLTNSGGFTSPAWWDSEHPTGSSGGDFYNWFSVPSDLKEFYEKIVTDGIQESVFSNCDVDWLCPDIRVPYADSLPFYEYGYHPEANYQRNRRLCELSYAKARSLLAKSYPLISTMYPSRGLTRFDDPDSFFGFDGGSAYYGITANSSEGYYPSLTYRYDILQSAIEGTADGFIFFDPMPSVIEIACTADITAGATGYDAQIRARNMFSTMMYGGAYQDGYVPSGSGYADPATKSELRRFGARRTLGYLDDIRESVNLASRAGEDNGSGNGWFRAAKNPGKGDRTDISLGESTNTSASDAAYGEQDWPQMLMPVCQCPPDCTDPDNPYGSNPMSCCCIKVYEYQNDSQSCPCPNISVVASPRNTTKCNDYAAACPDCGTVVTIDVSTLVAPCEGGGCYRDVAIGGACKCVNLLLSSGGANTCPDPPPPPPGCLACVCAQNEPTLVTDCDGSQGGGNAFDQAGTESPYLDSGAASDVFFVNERDYAFIVDNRNYKRADAEGSRFILYRRESQRHVDWRMLYEPTLVEGGYYAFIRAGETILNPIKSVDAIRTHLNKEVLRHLPNQYFTT